MQVLVDNCFNYLAVDWTCQCHFFFNTLAALNPIKVSFKQEFIIIIIV